MQTPPKIGAQYIACLNLVTLRKTSNKTRVSHQAMPSIMPPGKSGDDILGGSYLLENGSSADFDNRLDEALLLSGPTGNVSGRSS